MLAADRSNRFDRLLEEAQTLAPADTREQIVTAIFQTSAALCRECVTHRHSVKRDRTEQIDRIVTSKRWGFPIMLALLAAVLYMTIAGANVFSDSLARLFGTVETYLTMAFQAIHAPDWLHGLIVLGLYRGTAAVVSVMLPPMAIFFPLFALLENYGYLPRVAFNMDRLFKKTGAHGKQSLTMAMGFGCNAAAIMSTRIIESPRERMLAILTNNFVPCNGRWPTLILLSSLFMAAGYTGVGTRSSLPQWLSPWCCLASSSRWRFHGFCLRQLCAGFRPITRWSCRHTDARKSWKRSSGPPLTNRFTC